MKLKTKNLFYLGKLTCKLCGKTFHHLGSHIWHKHKILAYEYKEQFELPFREALIDISVYEKKKTHFEEHRKKYMGNLKKAGRKYQFKKGHTGQRRISQSERKRFIERIKRVNRRKEKLNPCPVCRIKFNDVAAHLYTKHRLIKV